ncbi:hypothetical protein RFI_14960 [Reticulomyxa filosa]|uniref:Uncharacterized protein n=1 Tax=Reticulomyxa filosa TaxID=46433 RepID=X6N7H8_RETFI|nr:hypothetical protein RFI_14960 [Reticulomyxa filosa]|eukprot:ETO22240.1 hypothetical protein RFI_14960 [Reticulomyxa filosa]
MEKMKKKIKRRKRKKIEKEKKEEKIKKKEKYRKKSRKRYEKKMKISSNNSNSKYMIPRLQRLCFEKIVFVSLVGIIIRASEDFARQRHRLLQIYHQSRNGGQSGSDNKKH